MREDTFYDSRFFHTNPLYKCARKQKVTRQPPVLRVASFDALLPELLARLQSEEQGRPRESPALQLSASEELEGFRIKQVIERIPKFYKKVKTRTQVVIRGGKIVTRQREYPDVLSEQISALVADQRKERGAALESSIFEEFSRLVEESEDFLRFYFRKHGEGYREVFLAGKEEGGLILSVLKNRLAMFRFNPPGVSTRLLLALGVNPLNDFSRISWKQFELLVKFALGTCSPLARNRVLLNFFMCGHQKLALQELRAVLKEVCNKLDGGLRNREERGVFRLIEGRLESLTGDEGEEVDRALLHQLLNNKVLLKQQDLASLITCRF